MGLLDSWHFSEARWLGRKSHQVIAMWKTLLILGILAAAVVTGVILRFLNKNSCTSSMFELNGGELLHPQEQTAQLPKKDGKKEMALAAERKKNRLVLRAGEEKLIEGLMNWAGKHGVGDELAAIPTNSQVAAFSPQAGLFAFVSQQGEIQQFHVKVLDLSTGSEASHFTTNGLCSGELEFSEDGSLLAVGSLGEENSTRIWDVKSGKLKTTVQITKIVFAPQGKKLAGTDGSNVKILDAETGQTLQSIGSMVPRRVVFSPSGTLLASVTEKNEVVLWDVESGRKIQELVFQNSVGELAFTHDGWGLAIAHLKTQFGPQSETVLWDLEKNSRRSVTNDNELFGLAISPDGKVLAYSNLNGLAFVDIDSGKELKRIAHFDAGRPYFFPGGLLFASRGTLKTRFWILGDLLSP